MPTKPTRQRLLVLFVVCLVYFITYLDRVNVSVAAPLLMQEFGISKAQLGAVFSAIFLAGSLPMIAADRTWDGGSASGADWSTT